MSAPVLSASKPNETRWIDAWIRWERNSKDCYGSDDDEEDDDSASVAPTDTFSFHYSTEEEGPIDIVLRGYHADSEQTWNSTGLTLWRSSHHLCEYLVRQREILKPNGRILELGSGLGRCGILAHKLSPTSEVFLTDGDTDTLAQLRDNVRRNTHSEGNISCHQLLWGSETSESFLKQHGGEKFDVLLGSDLVYVTGVVPALWETVRVLLSKNGGVFVMAHCSRREGNDVTIDFVLEASEKAGFKYTLVEEESDVLLLLFKWRKEADES